MLFYDPNIQPGTVTNDANGRAVRHVDAETFFTHLLGHVSHVIVPFLQMAPTAQFPPPASELLKVDEAVARRYWDEFKGCLLPPRVLAGVRRAAAGASTFTDLVEELRLAILTPEVTMDAALDERKKQRRRVLEMGAAGDLNDLQVATAEALIDLFAIERAAMEDVLRAERDRKPGQSRAEVIGLIDEQADLVWEHVLPKLMNPQDLGGLPAGTPGRVLAYARKRPRLLEKGVFPAIDLTGAEGGTTGV